MAHAAKIEPVTVATFLLFQIALIFLYAYCVEYSDDTKVSDTEQESDLSLTRLYPFFQDVHVMVFIGFGFLMTFMRRYSMTAVAFNYFVAAAMLMWTILVLGFWHRAFGAKSFFDKINLQATDLVTGDFGAASVLIAFGAVLGKVGPTQLLVMGILQIFFYALNESIGVIEYQAVDMGGSMYVHLFGALFGVACSFAYMKKAEVTKLDKDGKNASSRTTDTFAMVGTIFLFMFWPSFNGALAVGSPRTRVVINTVLAICASTTSAFLMSYVLRGGYFSMVDIQNATLAGGVAVGSSSDLVVDAWPSLLVGTIAGFVSVFGYVYLSPALESAGLHDTCGVLNLHGIPGMIGGISGAISAASAGESVYGGDIGLVFPARSSGRSASHQGAMQTACLFTTIGIAIAGGLVTGIVLKFIPNPGDARYEVFEDKRYWEELAEEDEEDEPLEIDAEMADKQEEATA